MISFEEGVISEIVKDKLYLTDLEGAEACTLDNSFTHAISLMSSKASMPVFKEHVTHLRFRIHDDEKENLNKVFAKSRRLFTQLAPSDKVVVHCTAGISRSATVVIAYFLIFKKLSLLEAYQRVKSCRPSIRPNEGFMDQLKRLENLK